MHRRTFLRGLVVVPLAAAVMPELAAGWVKGAAREAVRLPRLSLEELNTITMRQIMPAISDQFFKADPLLSYLRDTAVVRFEGRQMRVPIFYTHRP